MTRFLRNEGLDCLATARCYASKDAKPSWLSWPPRCFGKTGVAASTPSSSSQDRSAAAESFRSGVQRCLRPLPWQCTWAPVRRWTSSRRSRSNSEPSPQPGLQDHEQQGAVAAPCSRPRVRARQHGLDFVAVEEVHRTPSVAFSRDGSGRPRGMGCPTRRVASLSADAAIPAGHGGLADGRYPGNWRSCAGSPGAAASDGR